jgi:hypothetical protein
MKKQMVICGVFIAALALCCVMAPVSAVILEVTYKGPVSTVNEAKNTLTINNPEQYGCEYPAAGAPVCSWKPASPPSALTGTVPDAAALSVFKAGDTAVATSMGGAGGQWITLAKLVGPRPNEAFVTDIVGDPQTIPLPLVGEYAVETETVPDCTRCTGTVCTASQAKVAVKSTGSTVSGQTLAPGGSLSYNGRNDGSSVTVTFVKGEAAAQVCPGMGGMTGPQPVSTYNIHVVPPISALQQNIRTATTTRPDEARPTAPPTTAGTAPAPTQSGAVLPAGAIGALALLSLLWEGMRR